MVLDGEEDHPVPPKQVEQEVVLDHELPEVIAGLKQPIKPRQQPPGFQGSDGVGKERAPGLREQTRRRDKVVEESVQQGPEGAPAFRPEELANCIQVAGEVGREDRRPPSIGRSGRGGSGG